MCGAPRSGQRGWSTCTPSRDHIPDVLSANRILARNGLRGNYSTLVAGYLTKGHRLVVTAPLQGIYPRNPFIQYFGRNTQPPSASDRLRRNRERRDWGLTGTVANKYVILEVRFTGLRGALRVRTFSCAIESLCKNIQWTKEYWEAMQPHLDAGSYVNYVSDEGDLFARAAYGPNYDWLASLKDKYDPTNFFRMNHYIKPTKVAQAVG